MRWRLNRLLPICEFNVLIPGFDWAALPEGSIVVDVAGGVGNVTMALAERHKHLRYIIQDRPPVVKAADDVSNYNHRVGSADTDLCAQLWRSKMPGYVESGLVTLQCTTFPIWP